MPEIEISADQREYLDDLRADLEDSHVGAYGTVRPRDALQFLIDQYESGDSGGNATQGGEDEERPEDAHEDESGEGEDESGGGEDADGRLQAMMQLLDEHEDKWEAVDADDGKYAVELPDGETERVRTKDDVRALLFQHY